MVLNSIPFDFEEFINYKDFSTEGESEITLTKEDMDFLRQEDSRYFLVFEALQGHTLLDTLYDKNEVPKKGGKILFKILNNLLS